LSIPAILLYISLYAFVKRWKAAFMILSFPTMVGLWTSGFVAPVRCAALKALLRFAVASASMKLLDIHALSLTSSFPSYTAGSPPPPSLMALIILTELRYESFTPNPIRHPPIPNYPFPSSPEKRKFFYSERAQLLVHILIFSILQTLPQYTVIKALGILFTIWILWTSIEQLVRYRNSPPLFGPIWLADSLAGFWTETWHNAFASPCLSLAYTPTLYISRRLRVPRRAARSAAVVAAFSLMAVFHMYALEPLLNDEGRRKIGWFFVVNGIFTVAEVAVWGRKRHWARTVVAWCIELAISTWTIRAVPIADGVLGADWKGLC
ncbi:hypothetical protein CC78DRAFT_411118, partial [Lojkania enalia]